MNYFILPCCESTECPLNLLSIYYLVRFSDVSHVSHAVLLQTVRYSCSSALFAESSSRPRVPPRGQRSSGPVVLFETSPTT